jgi:hypothetical protein
MHEVTMVAEFKRLFGALADEAIKVDVPGMEIGTQHKYGIDILIDFKPEDSPMRPETAKAFKKRPANPAPEDLCDRGGLPAGIPLGGLVSESIKRSERDTFVVETRGFNAQTVLDALGHAHSDQLRVVERVRRRDFGHMDVEMTFDDPKMYTRPFTIRIPHNLMADDDISRCFRRTRRTAVVSLGSGLTGQKRRWSGSRHQPAHLKSKKPILTSTP